MAAMMYEEFLSDEERANKGGKMHTSGTKSGELADGGAPSNAIDVAQVLAIKSSHASE